MTRVWVVVGLFCVLFLGGCNQLGYHNTPAPTALTPVLAELQSRLLWIQAVGQGIGQDSLQLGPVIAGRRVFISTKKDQVMALELATGKILWKTTLNKVLTTGLGLGRGLLLLVSDKPELVALDQVTGHRRWSVPLPNQVLAKPAVAQGVIVLKTIDGQLMALDAHTGRSLWTYYHGSPTLVLRASSAPQIIADKVVVGFPDGQLVAVSLSRGQLIWEQTIATPVGLTEVDQLADIVADLCLADGKLYVASYQGTVAAVSLQTGRILWQQSGPHYTGLVLGKALYATDVADVVWAFDRSNGRRIWKQTALKNRLLTAPVLMGGYVLVADGQAYLHSLAQADGHIAARTLVKDKDQIIAPPVVNHATICVVTRHGLLSAWHNRALQTTRSP